MEPVRNEILQLEDVKNLVDTFYGKVRENDLLGPIFDNRIQDRWPEHLAKMYTFWQTILLGEHTYYGSPFPPHATLPVEKIHFETWLTLFYQTIDELFVGEKADEAKWRANKMVEMFQLKITQYKNSQYKSLI